MADATVHVRIADMPEVQERLREVDAYIGNLHECGDLMQSAASRLNAHLSRLGISLPYDEHMALLELRQGIDGWTKTRRKPASMEGR